jgi:hypothetical protein
MSLTTVAAPIVREPDAPLPRSRPERFQHADFVAAGLVFLITLAVYVATLAPNVTLEDSGELITGAAKFGVPHPPGYPLWTMSGFLISHLFPFGNLAWRVNLLSALFGGISNAVLTLLVCHSCRWLLQRWADEATQRVVRPCCFYIGLLAGLTIGFSNVVWGQAVISAVHGTLNALFVNLVLLFFYLWMLDPQKSHRLVITVFIFGLGLTNHHTLIQIIPALLIAACFLRAGKFWSVFLAVNLFSLSILVYLSWLSSDQELQEISGWMAFIILAGTTVVSFYYLKQFRLRFFLYGVLTAFLAFCYGHYIMGPSQTDTLRYAPGHAPFWLWGSFVHGGWLQISGGQGVAMFLLTALALGLLFTCNLDRRIIIGAFAAGWVGLVPYAYESFASNTHPPMNWGYTSERAGFYYAVSRQQYPESLPNLIKSTIGKAVGVVAQEKDAALGQPGYYHRLWLTIYYYGYNWQDDVTIPLICLSLALLLYLRRCDWAQANWLIFLVVAFFCLAFLLQLIEPQEAFDFERNLQYKVFHIQSHCILVIFMAYGALAALTYLQETWPEYAVSVGSIGLGMPLLWLTLLPFWSNVARCNQADHWFGWDFGHDIMKPMDRNAVYYGGSDFGRFVPTYMAFVESQQDKHWKKDPDFDRRDVTVITQNALCDAYYCHYIRDQYDPRFRVKPGHWTAFEKWLGRDKAYPKVPVTCLTDKELNDCWVEYEKRPEVAARMKAAGDEAAQMYRGAPNLVQLIQAAQQSSILRLGTNDVFDINGIAARKIFEKNKKDHTFYLEQSVAIDWMYPYLLPFGLIFKMNPEPLKALPDAAVAADVKFWDDYSQRLLRDPKFRLDDDATVTFGKLVSWHADLYRYWNREKEQEHFLQLAHALCPQLQDVVLNLTQIMASQHRFDEAVALIKQAEMDDPRNDSFAPMLPVLAEEKSYVQKETDLRTQLSKSPYNVELNLELARTLEGEGKSQDVDNLLRFVAGLTNWDRPDMAGVVEYYVDHVHDPEAAIAFLEARVKIEPKASEMIYTLAALNAFVNHKDEAIKYLTQAISVGGTNAMISAKIDPRFQNLQGDPRFQALVSPAPTNTPPAHVAAVPQPIRPAASASPSKKKKTVPNAPVPAPVPLTP